MMKFLIKKSFVFRLIVTGIMFLSVAFVSITAHAEYGIEGNNEAKVLINYNDVVTALSGKDGVRIDGHNLNPVITIEARNQSTSAWFQRSFPVEPFENVVLEFIGKTDAPDPYATTGGGFIVEFFDANSRMIGGKYNAYVISTWDGFHRYCYPAPRGTSSARVRMFSREQTCISLCNFSLYTCAASCIPKDGTLRYDGHLGAIYWAPKNTMPALELGKAAGYDTMIVNVRATKDDVLVCIHDQTITATSNGTGNVKDYTYNQLLEFDFGSWFNPIYAGTKILTFREAAEYISNSGMGLGTCIHGNALSRDNLRDLCDIYREYGDNEGSFIKSYDINVLSQIYEELGDAVDYIWVCTASTENIDRVSAYRGKCNIEFPTEQITHEIVNYARKKNVCVSAYFGNDSRRVRNLYNMGVNRFCIDTSPLNTFPLYECTELNPLLTLNFGTGHEDYVTERFYVGQTLIEGFTVVSVEGATVNIQADKQVIQTIAEAKGYLEMALSQNIDKNDAYDGEQRMLYTIYPCSADAYQSLTGEEYQKLLDRKMSEDTVFFAYWEQPVHNASLTVKQPICGTEVSKVPVDNGSAFHSDPQPELTVSEGISLDLAVPVSWVTDMEEELIAGSGAASDDESLFEDTTVFEGTVSGGKMYFSAGVEAAFGYYLADDFVLTLNGGEIIRKDDNELCGTVKVLHTEFDADDNCTLCGTPRATDIITYIGESGAEQTVEATNLAGNETILDAGIY